MKEEIALMGFQVATQAKSVFAPIDNASEATSVHVSCRLLKHVNSLARAKYVLHYVSALIRLVRK